MVPDRLESEPYIAGMFWWKWIPGSRHRGDFSMRHPGVMDIVRQAWHDRPALPGEPVAALPVRFAGENIRSKLSRVREATNEAGATALVVTMLDAIAWLFNIRGRDVDFNPVALAYAVITADRAAQMARP